MTAAFSGADAAREALRIALPMIEPLMADRRICGSGFLYIVVMDPAAEPGEVGFDDAVLLEHAVGDRGAWDADYAAFARAKAAASWRHRIDGHALQMLAPHRLRSGDTLLWGAVVLDGITVGVSGAHAPWDEAFATTIAACLRAVAKQRRQDAVDARHLAAP